jgi:hypothetical protein
MEAPINTYPNVRGCRDNFVRWYPHCVYRIDYYFFEIYYHNLLTTLGTRTTLL